MSITNTNVNENNDSAKNEPDLTMLWVQKYISSFSR